MVNITVNKMNKYEYYVVPGSVALLVALNEILVCGLTKSRSRFHKHLCLSENSTLSTILRRSELRVF